MSKKPNPQTGIILVYSFPILFIVNALVALAANYFFPQHLVLGTQFINLPWAIIHSMGTLAMINILFIPIIREIENKKGHMLTPKQWLIKYFILNFISLWIISRMPEQLGMGISSWYVAATLALALDIAQGATMMQLEKYRK